jgi:ABC-type multidrug transport system fused ATPase/permease subunit
VVDQTVLVSPTPPRDTRNLHLFFRFLKFARQTRREGLLGICFLAASALLQLPLPLISAWLIDEALRHKNTHVLIKASILLLSTGLLLLFARFAQSYFTALFTERTKAHVMSALVRKVTYLSVRQFRTRPSGYLLSRLRDDVNVTNEILSNVPRVLLGDGATVIFGSAVILSLDIRLALTSLLLLPAYVIALRIFNRHLRDATWHASEAGALLTQEMQESLAAHDLIHAFGAEAYHQERFEKRLRTVVEKKIHAVVVNAKARLSTSVVTVLGPLLILWLGAIEYIHGRLTLGDLFAFNTYLAFLFGSANGLLSINFSYQQLSVALTRIFEVLDIDDNIEPLYPVLTIDRPRGAIKYASVSFSYTPGQLVLRDITFSISPGDHVAVVGRSGAGKTTLLSLLLRLYDPQYGHIFIDDVDIRHLSIADLRRLVAVVPQETLLVSGTIAENISYGYNADEQNIQSVARMANADVFIEKLPLTYATVIGERGHNLSCGEKQRIAIARALLRSPKVLVFDEATSNLDPHSEQLIRAALDKLRGSVTVVTIAHRLYTIQTADRILFLDAGQLLMEGSHEQLYATFAPYRTLVDEQSNPLPTASETLASLVI